MPLTGRLSSFMGFCMFLIRLRQNAADVTSNTVGQNGTSGRSRRRLQRISADQCIPWCVVVQIVHTTLPQAPSRICGIMARPHTPSPTHTRQWPRTSFTFSRRTSCQTSHCSAIQCKHGELPRSAYKTRLMCSPRVSSRYARGGKVAMAVALDPGLPPELLTHLIVADIVPARGALSPEFQGYIEAMKRIEASEAKTRQEADRVLQPYEQVLSHTHSSNRIRTRVPPDMGLAFGARRILTTHARTL